ncbi:hypothetical protein M5C72_00440 [Companilactobacillus allii]|uniref:Uncharacterized protein n=1 Tax=Companilactobacillus allii TaxID=1847728 RepID=A0A1P8Q1F2_9LACO|nr:hypothetical protein [Companilactobacillus allii]APX71655.1 hypothetical protein BTM29_03375 [Companilactobacillus allii]USQ68738.1 hypothetical protein M5C72_00440 [Companilactobacillus allii]
MIKFSGVTKFIPTTWIVQFHSHDAAHNYYRDSIAKFDDDLGTVTVNNDTWYIGTKMNDKEFNAGLIKFMAKAKIADSEYSVEKTQVGWFMM